MMKTLSLFLLLAIVNSTLSVSVEQGDGIESNIDRVDETRSKFQLETELLRNRLMFSQSSNNFVYLNLLYHINCYQGKSWSAWSTGTTGGKYGKYGCWCGVGGKGKTVDNIDKCCKKHDMCYKKASIKHKGSSWNTKWGYSMTYKMTCSNRRSKCYGKGFSRDICDCDKAFGACLQPVKNQWKFKYWLFFDKDDDC